MWFASTVRLRNTSDATKLKTKKEKNDTEGTNYILYVQPSRRSQLILKSKNKSSP